MENLNPIARLSTFLRDVQAELLKCNWPTWSELRQSTLVVVVSFFIMGAFVSFSDALLRTLVRVLL
ncbi:preprotein translocase subunit SecE [Kiritimatiellaeota bacterium B1221]|nr:preprotein translocase subunit SecE [Kiritimatiellaeota bacterium B1221]